MTPPRTMGRGLAEGERGERGKGDGNEDGLVCQWAQGMGVVCNIRFIEEEEEFYCTVHKFLRYNDSTIFAMFDSMPGEDLSNLSRLTHTELFSKPALFLTFFI